MKKTRQFKRDLRQARVRRHVSGSTARPRLSVFKSNKHIYAQIIDDAHGITVAAASSTSAELKAAKPPTRKEVAAWVGKKVAEKALTKGVKQVVFDRGGFLYHGRIKALADGAREGGLQF